MLFFLLFSIPSAKRILTWDTGSPSKGRDPEQDIPFSHEGDLTAYIQGVMEGTLISLAKPYVIYLLATHFVRVKWPLPFFPCNPGCENLTVFNCDTKYIKTLISKYANWKSFSFEWLQTIFSLWKFKTVTHCCLIIIRFWGKFEWISHFMRNSMIWLKTSATAFTKLVWKKYSISKGAGKWNKKYLKCLKIYI